jgi:hypothetical protein
VTESPPNSDIHDVQHVSQSHVTTATTAGPQTLCKVRKAALPSSLWRAALVAPPAAASAAAVRRHAAALCGAAAAVAAAAGGGGCGGCGGRPCIVSDSSPQGQAEQPQSSDKAMAARMPRLANPLATIAMTRALSAHSKTPGLRAVLPGDFPAAAAAASWPGSLAGGEALEAAAVPPPPPPATPRSALRSSKAGATNTWAGGRGVNSTAFERIKPKT